MSTEPVPYTFVSINRQDNEDQAHIAIFHRFTDTNIYRTGSVKKCHSPQNIHGYTNIFFTV